MSKKQRYNTVEDIPLHVFSNKECTKTTSPALLDYLEYMIENHEQDLAYLWRHSQKYTRHGGMYRQAWELWLNKLKRDVKQSREEL